MWVYARRAPLRQRSMILFTARTMYTNASHSSASTSIVSKPHLGQPHGAPRRLSSYSHSINDNAARRAADATRTTRSGGIRTFTTASRGAKIDGASSGIATNASVTAKGRDRLGDAWPRSSVVAEPPWEQDEMMTFAYRVPNYIETYLRLRDVKTLVRSADALNQLLMDTFVNLRKLGELSHEQASIEAAATLKAMKGNLVPFECEIVQARKAEHHNMTWIQIVARMQIQDLKESRLIPTYVTVETPLPDTPPFRVADIRPA